MCETTCFYLLTEDVSQYVIVDIMNQDKTAVVRENVLLKLLQLLHTNDTLDALWSDGNTLGQTAAVCSTYTLPFAVHRPGESRQSDLQQSLPIEPPLNNPAVIIQLLLKHNFT